MNHHTIIQDTQDAIEEIRRKYLSTPAQDDSMDPVEKGRREQLQAMEAIELHLSELTDHEARQRAINFICALNMAHDALLETKEKITREEFIVQFFQMQDQQRADLIQKGYETLKNSS